MQKLYTKLKFSELAGVNASTVTRHCDTILKDALVGKRIDAAHPAAQAYLKNREFLATRHLDETVYNEVASVCLMAGDFSKSFIQSKFGFEDAAVQQIIKWMEAAGFIPATPVASFNSESQTYEIPKDIQAFADMTLRELIERFGTETKFTDWLKATREIEAINEKRLKNAETEGRLVARKAVKLGIIEPFESMHIKLLTDGAKTLSVRCIALHEAGRGIEEIETFIKEQITSFIRPVKAKVQRMFKGL